MHKSSGTAYVNAQNSHFCDKMRITYYRAYKILLAYM